MALVLFFCDLDLHFQGITFDIYLIFFDALLLFHIAYAAVAWTAFATAAECNAMQTFLNKVKRWDNTSDGRRIDDIFI